MGKIDSDENQDLLGSIKQLFQEWLAINYREQGRPGWMELFQEQHLNRLTAAEKNALPTLAASQLSWIKVDLVEYEADELWIQGRTGDSSEISRIWLYEFEGNENILAGRLIVLRTFDLHGIKVGSEPCLISKVIS